MVINCDICHISVPSDVDMQQHLKGKRHINNVKLVDYRQQQNKSSIFVRGFSQSTSEKDVKNYFTKFGNIIKWYFDHKQRHFAIVEYETVAIAQKVLASKYHNINGYRVTVKEREGKPNHAKPPPKMKKKRPQISKVECESGVLNDSDLLELFGSANDINEQMEILQTSMCLTEESIQQRDSICLMLSQVLQTYFPASTLHQFGSSVNGFGVNGCDLDLFLDFNDDKEEVQKHNKVQSNSFQLVYVRDIPSLKKNRGPLYSQDLQHMTLYDKAKLVSRILCENAAGCNEIFCIPSTRCPVVRFIHEPSGLKCDLSVNNRLALRNTQLLALYSKLDKRVKLLVFTIRYWAKLRKIAGNENAGPRLTNYALTCLVIFYLQNTTPPVICSLDSLSSLTDKKCMIDGWDCSFIEDLNKVPKSVNTQTSAQLLENFFKFYSNLEFSTVVLQCHTAKPKILSVFAEEMSSSQQLTQFKFGPLSVQDPFVLEHNITLNVNDKTKQKIVQQFKIASAMSADWSKIDQSSIGENQWGLIGLLTSELLPEYKEMETSDKEVTFTSPNKYSFPVNFKTAMLSESAFKQLQTKGDYRYHWCLHVCTFLHRLLSEILLITIELESSNLKSTSEQFQNIHGETSDGFKSENFLREFPQLGKGARDLNSEHQLRISESLVTSKLSKKSVPNEKNELSYLNIEEESDRQENAISECSMEVTNSEMSQDTRDIESINGQLDSQLSTSESNNEQNCQNNSVMSINDDPSCDHVSANYVAGIVIDVHRAKRLSSDSLDETDSKRSKIFLTKKDPVTLNITTENGQSSSTSASNNDSSHVEMSALKKNTQVSLKSENELNNLGSLVWKCSSDNAVCNSRKVVRKELIMSGRLENLELEKLVSLKINENSRTQNEKFKLGFKCFLKPQVSSGNTAVQLTFEPLENKKQFSCFYQFLKTFVSKTVDRYLFRE